MYGHEHKFTIPIYDVSRWKTRMVCEICQMFQDEVEPVEPIDGRSEEGETVSLIDAVMIAARMVSRRDLSTRTRESPVLHALADLWSDEEFQSLLELSQNAYEVLANG